MSKKTEKANADKRITLVKNEGGTSGVSSLLQPLDKGLPGKMVVKSRSPMMKPSQVPTDRRVVGMLRKLIVCVSGKKEDGGDKLGVLIELVPPGHAVGAAIPATAVIAGALDMTGVGTAEPHCPYIGHLVAIRRLEDKIPSKKGNDTWNFIVEISEEPLKVMSA